MEEFIKKSNLSGILKDAISPLFTEHSLNIASINEKISQQSQNIAFTQTDLDELKKLIDSLWKNVFSEKIKRIYLRIDLEESTGYDPRAISRGEYYSRPKASLNEEYLVLLDKITAALMQLLPPEEGLFPAIYQKAVSYAKDVKHCKRIVGRADNLYESVFSKSPKTKEIVRDFHDFMMLIAVYKHLLKNNTQNIP